MLLIEDKIQQFTLKEGASEPPTKYEDLVLVLVEVILEGHRRHTLPDPA